MFFGIDTCLETRVLKRRFVATRPSPRSPHALLGSTQPLPPAPLVAPPPFGATASHFLRRYRPPHLRERAPAPRAFCAPLSPLLFRAQTSAMSAEKKAPKFLKAGKVVILLTGRQAGKKALIVKTFDDGTQDRPYGHCLVAGIMKYPLKVTKPMSEKKIAKRSSPRPRPPPLTPAPPRLPARSSPSSSASTTPTSCRRGTRSSASSSRW